MLENALVCKKIGGTINGDFCYVNEDYLKEADLACPQVHGRITSVWGSKLSLCEIPLAELSLISEHSFKHLERLELERINPPTKPIGFVQTKDGVPMVSVSTTEHRPFNEETLKEAIQRVLAQQDKFRAEVGDNWFPCGFVNLHIGGRDPLVLFIKKYGHKKENQTNDYKFNELEIWRDSFRGGYTLIFRYPERDAMECQSMNFANKMYGELQKQLALLGIRADIESRVD